MTLSDPGRDSPTPPQASAALGLLSRRELMTAVKDAVKELIEEQFTTFGRWTFKTLFIAAVGAAVALILWAKQS